MRHPILLLLLMGAGTWESHMASLDLFLLCEMWGNTEAHFTAKTLEITNALLDAGHCRHPGNDSCLSLPPGWLVAWGAPVHRDHWLPLRLWDKQLSEDKSQFNHSQWAQSTENWPIGGRFQSNPWKKRPPVAKRDEYGHSTPSSLQAPPSVRRTAEKARPVWFCSIVRVEMCRKWPWIAVTPGKSPWGLLAFVEGNPAAPGCQWR